MLIERRTIAMNYLIRILLIVLSSALSSTALTADRVLLIEGIIEPPLRWYDENNVLRGIDIDIITLALSKMEDIIPRYKIRLLESSPRLRINWQAGKSDMVFSYSKKEDREKYLYYANVSHITQSYSFFLKKDFAESQKKAGREVKFNGYSDLKDYTFAATKSIAYTPEFWKNVNDGTLKTSLVVHNELTMRMLIHGRVDIIPHNLIPGFWIAEQGGYSDQIVALPKPLKEKKYFNTFVKKSDYPGIRDKKIIKRYDEVITSMKSSGDIKRIMQKYGIQ